MRTPPGRTAETATDVIHHRESNRVLDLDVATSSMRGGTLAAAVALFPSQLLLWLLAPYRFTSGVGLQSAPGVLW